MSLELQGLSGRFELLQLERPVFEVELLRSIEPAHAAERVEDGRGPNGGVSSLIKLAWSSLGQSFAEYAADVDGLAAIAGDTPASIRSGGRLVSSRSNTIAGGTTEVMKNIIGERSLGLPREPKA